MINNLAVSYNYNYNYLQVETPITITITQKSVMISNLHLLYTYVI